MTNWLQKKIRLSAYQWWLLLQSLFMLPLVAVLLRFIGYNRTKSFLGKFNTGKNHAENPQASHHQAKEFARVVSIAAVHGPYHANCLKQSLVLWWLHGRHGLVSEIRFGIRASDNEPFGAHAWVEYNGTNIMDSEVLQEKISPFPDNG